MRSQLLDERSCLHREIYFLIKIACSVACAGCKAVDSSATDRQTYRLMQSFPCDKSRPSRRTLTRQSSTESPESGCCQGSDVAVLGLADRKPSL